MAGLYGGSFTIGELLEHGDLGVGTLDSIDGELIVLDGKAYQAKGSGDHPEIVEVSLDAKVPYAVVVPHQAEVIFRQRFEMTDEELEARIESYYDGENLSAPLRFVVTLPRCMSVWFQNPHQRWSLQRLQPISQSIYGKMSLEPSSVLDAEIFHGVSVAGYHCTLASDDHTFGGHVMDFVITEGIVEVGAIDQLDQRFPVQDRQYLFAKFNFDEVKKDI